MLVYFIFSSNTIECGEFTVYLYMFIVSCNSLVNPMVYALNDNQLLKKNKPSCLNAI